MDLVGAGGEDGGRAMGKAFWCCQRGTRLGGGVWEGVQGLGRALRQAQGVWRTAKDVVIQVGRGVKGALVRRWRVLQKWRRRIQDGVCRSKAWVTRLLAVWCLFGKVPKDMVSERAVVLFSSPIKTALVMPFMAFAAGGGRGAFSFYAGEGLGQEIIYRWNVSEVGEATMVRTVVTASLVISVLPLAC